MRRIVETIIVSLATALAVFFPFHLRAATAVDATDQPSSLTAGVAANHKISVTLSSGFDEGETLTIVFPSGFVTTAIGEDDVDVADDGVDLTTASSCSGSEQLSVAMSSNTLTITACVGDGGSIASGSVVTIEIGLNASSSGLGSQRIVNPSTTGTYYLSLGGTFGDTASLPVPIVSSSSANVSATVPGSSSSSGGGGGSLPSPDPIDDEEDPQEDSDPVSPDDTVDDPVVDPDDGEGADDDAGDPLVDGDTGADGDAGADNNGVEGRVPETSSGGIDVVDRESSSGESDVGGNEEVDDGGSVLVPDEVEGDGVGDGATDPVIDRDPSVPREAEDPIRASPSFIDRFRDLPEVKFLETIALPVVAVTAVASVVTLAGVFGLFGYLQYLFTSPILFFWRRKRNQFGVVYNSMTKVAIVLATVRLFNVQTGRLVRTVVTDSAGRYAIAVRPGNYRLLVQKPGFTFPSSYLQDVKDDGAYLDVYSGQDIEVTENDALLAVNVPLDPQQIPDGSDVRKIVLQKWVRRMQWGVAFTGLFLACFSLIITPSAMSLLAVLLQIVIFVLVLRLARPQRARGWGIVYDRTTQKPVGNAVVRLFEPKYNKLVETALTDESGRYSFVLGPNEYYASFAKKGYRDLVVRPIDYRDKHEPTAVTVDVPLEPNGGL